MGDGKVSPFKHNLKNHILERCQFHHEDTFKDLNNKNTDGKIATLSAFLLLTYQGQVACHIYKS